MCALFRALPSPGYTQVDLELCVDSYCPLELSSHPQPLGGKLSVHIKEQPVFFSQQDVLGLSFQQMDVPGTGSGWECRDD